MLDLLRHLALLLVFSSMIGTFLTFSLIMRAIARRERTELADLTRGGK